MWVSSSILNLKSSGLTHWFTRTKAFRYIWSRTFLLPPLSDYNPRLHSVSGNTTHFASRHYASNAGFCSSNPFGEDFDTTLKHFEVSDTCVEAIRNVLIKHSWIQRFGVKTLDASIALYFFRWSELWIGVEHSSRSICRMIHIFVSGNMNFGAVDMLLRLVKRSDGVYLVMKDLFETRGDRLVLEIVFSMLVDCCVKERKVDMAMKLAYKMDKHLNAAVISLFICKHCSDGCFDKAWELLMEMKQQYVIKPDIVAFTIFIHTLCKSGFLKEATSVLFNLKLFGISQDSVSVSCVIDGFCKAGKPEEAVRLIHYFCLRPKFFVDSSFLFKICTEGDMLKASTYFGAMLKSGNSPSLMTYTLLIGACRKFGDVGDAEALFRNMKVEGLVPDVVTYNNLMQGYGNT
ncbi:hypothetical protein N665_0703s0004 [Sinapis alba]|nr:hypothetical protein N665_0703s0004 [Sinapis alba]